MRNSAAGYVDLCLAFSEMSDSGGQAAVPWSETCGGEHLVDSLTSA